MVNSDHWHEGNGTVANGEHVRIKQGIKLVISGERSRHGKDARSWSWGVEVEVGRGDFEGRSNLAETAIGRGLSGENMKTRRTSHSEEVEVV